MNLADLVYGAGNRWGPQDARPDEIAIVSHAKATPKLLAETKH